jgi:hypothetical protein
MSQGLRDMLTNRRFAIPLIVLLAFCFIGLLLIGIILIWRPGAPAIEEPVAEVTATLVATATDSVPPTSAPPPTNTVAPSPTATLVPVGTPVSSAGEDEELGTEGGGTPVSSEGETTSESTPVSSGAEQATAEPTATVAVEDEQLAQTGVGWGLILASGAGLAGLVIAARRLRMTV